MRTPIQKIFISLSTVLMLSALLVLSNCGKKTDDPTATSVQPTFSSLYTNVFSQRCVECHHPDTGGGAGQGTLAGATFDFSSGAAQAYATFANSAIHGTTSLGASCSGVNVSNNPQTSFVLAVFFSEYGTGSNWTGMGCTPYDHTAFPTAVPSAAEKAALVQWITNGALNN